MPPNENYGECPPSGPSRESGAEEPEVAVVYTSDELMKGCREILIRHHGEVYRLRVTRNDKLILNK